MKGFYLQKVNFEKKCKKKETRKMNKNERKCKQNEIKCKKKKMS